MALRFPRLLGEIHDKDTQFSAFVKQNQEIVLIGGAIAIVAIAAMIYTSFFGQSRQGTWRYAVCKVFLEQYAEYPTHLRIITVAEKQNSAQIGYLLTNSYGSQESELMECFYNTEGGQVALNRVTIDRKNLVLKKPETDVSEAKERLTYQQIFNLWDAQYDSLAMVKYPSVSFELFNKTIPIIMAQENLDTKIPLFLPKDLEDLKL